MSSRLSEWLDRKQGEWHDETLDALRAVVELHKSVLGFGGPGTSEDCNHCHATYPCRTIRVIEREVLR